MTLLRYDYSVCFVTYLVVFYRHYCGKMYLFCKVREAGLCPEGCWFDPQNRQGKDAVTHIMNTGRYLAFVHFHSLFPPPNRLGPWKHSPFSHLWMSVTALMWHYSYLLWTLQVPVFAAFTFTALEIHSIKENKKEFNNCKNTWQLTTAVKPTLSSTIEHFSVHPNGNMICVQRDKQAREGDRCIIVIIVI